MATHKIYDLPIVIMMPHSRCNCRCVMCDIWKANQEKREISVETLTKHVNAMRKLHVRQVVFSGGEALMHSNLWALCDLLTEHKIQLTLLTTGMTVEKHAPEIVRYFHDVIVSLDGSRAVHDRIRNIPGAFDKLATGIKALHQMDRDYRVTGRCVLQRDNYQDLLNIIDTAKILGLHQISFLAADISSAAFNHEGDSFSIRKHDLALDAEECDAFQKLVERSMTVYSKDYQSRFIAESPQKMKRLVQYYRAINGQGEFPEPVCNAPWVSAVIEPDGKVMPCFFHESYGNLYDENLSEILNSESAITFRKGLHIKDNPVCQKCVCSLKLGVL